MSKIALTPNASGTGTLTIAAPNTSTDRTLTLPDVTTTLVGTDATQTLTNKTIASSQLTGALPAIDGSALTGIVTGGVTLLGTIATTSGSTVTLSGLTLTSYKFLTFSWNGVSGTSAGGPARFKLNGNTLYILSQTLATETTQGQGTIDLTTGMFVSIGNSGAATSNAAAEAHCLPSGITTASTSISFTADLGTFDAGSILIYGVK